MYRRSVGFGAVISADGTDFSYPPQCSYDWVSDPLGIQYLAAQFSSDCAPPTPAQLQAMQVAQLAKIAAVNPALAASGLQAGDAAAAGVAALDPSGAANYNLVSNLYNPPPVSATNWLLIGGVAVAAVLLFSMAGR